MDAAARSNTQRTGHHRGDGAPLRLRHAPVGDPVDSVVESFLGGTERATEARACGDKACRVCEPMGEGGAEFKPLGLRCPEAASVVIGVEPTGRVCLEVHVGSGTGVANVLRELEEAEKWLRRSAHAAAMVPVIARVDMSHPVRRRVVADAHGALGVLRRAGVEVRGTA